MLRNRAPIGVFIWLLVSVTTGILFAQVPQVRTLRQARIPYTPLDLAGEIPSERITRGQQQCDWPALAVGRDGTLWVAYVRWNGRDADEIVLARRRAESDRFEEVTVLEDGNWDHYAPDLAPYGDGVFVVWPGQVEGNYELYYSLVDRTGKATKPARLTRAAHGDFNVKVVSTGEKEVVVVWQSFRNGNADIFLRSYREGKWGPERRVSPSEANDWEPDVAVSEGGRVWISWDSYHHGNYDVFVRSFHGERFGPVIRITSEPSAQFHSAIAVDKQGRVWVTWDDGGVNWGMDFSRSSAVEGSRGLHWKREIGMRVYANGRVQEVAADFRKVLSGRMLRYVELPRLIFDGDGSLWMLFRHWTYIRPTEIYHFYAAKLSGGQWSKPYRLKQSSGRNSQWVSVDVGPDGRIVAVWSSDGRSPQNLPKDQMHALHYQIYTAVLPRGGAAVQVALRDAALPAAGTRPKRRRRAVLRVGKERYVLLLGDCHRHTDIRGHSNVDASVLDTYRYALDAAQLDFLGVSDHNEVVGGSWPDGLRDYQWWWVQKAVDLFTHEPYFIGIYSYEHSMSSPAGHRNMLFLKRGAPLRAIDRRKGRQAPDNLPPALWKWVRENVLTQRGQRVVIVPHTFAAGPLADWNWDNPPFDCLLEIYQGARGSYEAWRLPPKEKRGPTQTDEPGHFARDALARGNVYGFVSFSDHSSTHNSWAGVWAKAATRSDLFEGMLARRTFAASDEIVLKVTGSGHAVGEQFSLSANEGIVIEAEIEAPDEILRVDIVKNGRYVYTVRPGGRRVKLSWTDQDVQPGRAYYYVRVFQRDPENPEGDPEIGWASPFFVEYR